MYKKELIFKILPNPKLVFFFQMNPVRLAEKIGKAL